MSSISKNVLDSIEATSGDGNNRVRVEFRRLSLPSNWFLALIAVPMLIAFGISGYLTYVTLTASKIAGCSGGDLFDCSHVIYSKWSKFMGIPVSALALGTYVAMILATGVTCFKNLSSPTRLVAWSAVTGLAIAAAMAGLYFIYLQVFVLEHLCPWCLGAHTCGLIIALAVLICKSRIALPPLTAVSGLAAAGLAIMIGVQVYSEEPPKFEEIVYTPPEETAESPNGTFTAAPQDFEAAPGDDDSMMLPPDDDLFAPPEDDEYEDEEYEEDDEDFDGTPSEDTEEIEAAVTELNELKRAAFAGLGLVRDLALINNPIHLALVLQNPVQQQQKTDKSAMDQKTDPNKQMKKKKKKKRKKPEPRIVEFMGQKLNAHQWPIDGSPTAKHVFVEMFDYTCPHCRTTSQTIFKAKEALGDDLAVVVLAVPMKIACNPHVQRDHPVHAEACQLSTLGVAVWRCDAKKFSEFHKWMFEGKDAPNYASALGKATALVGKERLEKELNKKTAAAYVQRHCQMYKTLNAGPIPKLLFPKRAIQGEFTSVESLTSMIQQETVSQNAGNQETGN